jgi:hypothetical protein
MAGDFAILMGGATVLRHGGNPYDRTAVYRSETAMLRREHVAIPKPDSFIRVGNPPLLFWALEPLTTWPFVRAAWAWLSLMFVLLSAGLWRLLSYLGWRRRAAPLALFLAMPQTVLAAYYGNVDGIVFAAVAFGVALMRRSPFIGGMMLSVALLKPQIGLPVATLAIVFLAAQRRRALAGFAAACGLALLLTIATTGWRSVLWWVDALTGYSRQISVQPDIASLSGLYVYWSSDRLRIALELLSIAVAVAATVVWWLRRDGAGPVAPAEIAWLWVVWFLATPFAHFHDEVILAIPILAILGADARAATRRLPAIALYMMLLSVLLFPTSRLHTDLQSLALLPVAACAFWIGLTEARVSRDRQPEPELPVLHPAWEGRALAR